MLPGVGIFGSDPICKVLIQILKHFEFEINAIWTNFYEFDSVVSNKSSSSSSSTVDHSGTSTKNNSNSAAKLITTSIDNVLLNKNVNLVFVCCQPNLHSQISTKALGIGKNVICLFPTCKNIEEIDHMIQSARYYPSLMSSVNYGGLKYLSEFRLLKQSMPLIGELKVCNINISCQNLAVVRNLLYKKHQQHHHQSSGDVQSSSQPSHMSSSTSSISNLIDQIALAASSTNASASLNWLIDRDLGAGLLNRFGAAVVSLVLNLFDDKKVTRVFGSVRTLLDDLNVLDAKMPTSKSTATSIRRITADDFCSFQMNLEPGSILVNVTLNSLAQSKYSQEFLICGTKGILAWSNSKIVYRSTSKDANNNITSTSLSPGVDIVETELHSNETVDKSAEVFLNSYKSMEDRHPELPLMYIRGLYYYLEHVKREFVEMDKIKSQQQQQQQQQSKTDSTKSTATKTVIPNLENFEHTRVVQMIVKSISQASIENRWITLNY